MAESAEKRSHAVPVATGTAVGVFGVIAMALDQVDLLSKAASALGPVGLVGLFGFAIYAYSNEKRIEVERERADDHRARADDLQRALGAANKAREEREAAQLRALERLGAEAAAARANGRTS